MKTPYACDSLLLAKLSKLTPPSYANSCLTVSGIVYWSAGLLGYTNEIDLVLTTFKKICKNTRGRLELLTSI